VRADAKLLGANQGIQRLQVKENEVLLLLRPNYVSYDIFRFDIVRRTLLYQVHLVFNCIFSSILEEYLLAYFTDYKYTLKSVRHLLENL
jgi:hypothetical protein